MNRIRRLLLFVAGALCLLAACGGPPAPRPDLITPALRGLLQAGTTMESTSSGPGASKDITGLSVTPDGRRIALLYGDGHVIVWDVLRHKKLLSTPPQQLPQIWLTGGGNMLAVEPNLIPPSKDSVQLWEIGHEGKGTSFHLTTDWVWMDPTLSHILIVPNFTETCPDFTESVCHGVPGLIWYDMRNSRLMESSPPSSAPLQEPNGKLESQPPNLTPTDIEYNDGTFAIASSAQDGFVVWKPGSKPVETDAQCQGEGALTGNGQLFACTSGQADALSLWSVPQGRMIRQMLLPDYVVNNQQTTIQSVSFADDGSLLAVAEGRQAKPDIIRIYNVSNFQLVRTLTLVRAAGQFDTISLWSAGRSLIVHEQTGSASSVFSVFSLGA
jgi:WD40 repeat protein